MKIFFKKLLLVILLLCILIPSLFSGFALADTDNIKLTQERAGNYASTFAINFFENWSNRNLTVGYSTTNSTAGIAKTADMLFKKLQTKKVKYGNGTSIKDIVAASKDDNKEIKEINEITFVAAVIYSVTGESEFDHEFNCSSMYGALETGNSPLRKRLQEKGWEIKTYKECLDQNDLELKTGDILISRTDNHCNIVKATKVGPRLDGYSYYVGWDCGNEENWLVNTKIFDYESIQRCWKVNDKNYKAVRIRINNSNNKSGEKSFSKSQIKTEYDENATAEGVNASDDKYKFSNISWINFVYRQTFGYNFDIVSAGNIREDYFDDESKLFGESLAKESEYLDITRLITEGQIAPGDILYVYNGIDSGEYLLYVGGTKVIYATPPKESETSSGALRYEYLNSYLTILRNNIMNQSSEDNSGNGNSTSTTTENTNTTEQTSNVVSAKKNTEELITSYGVTHVYRINREKAEALTEGNVNLFYNGKGYNNVSKYEGIVADDHISAKHERKGDFIFSAIFQLVKFFLNLIVYIIKMQIIGWANIVESILQSVLLGISGNNGETRAVEAFGQSPPTSSSGKRITVESVFFNNIPILDVNFYNFKTAGGYNIEPPKEEDASQTTGTSTTTTINSGEESTSIIAEVNKKDNNVVYTLRKNLATWYFILRNLAIALMLIALLYIGIRMAISTIPEKKAMYKSSLMGWVTGFIIICFIDIFMYVVIASNQFMVDTLKEVGKINANEIVYADAEGVNREEGREEINLYDAVRIKAYSFKTTESVPALIIYLFLIYLLIRFSLIYAKRVVTVYVLALMGPIIGVKYAFDRASGKRTKTLNSWMKDFAFNVFLQTIHVLLYTLYMATAISVAQTNLAGFAICLIILNAMLKADKIVINIFGLNKAGSLADVNKQESWIGLAKKFLPIATMSKGVFDKGKNFFVGKRGLVAEIRYLGTGADNYKDAEKEVEKKKIAHYFGAWQKVDNIIKNRRFDPIRAALNKTPIRKIKSLTKYRLLLGKDVSFDTKKALFANIKNAKKMKYKRFTRNVQFGYDVATGFLNMGAAAAVAIESPVAGLGLFRKGKKKIDTYRTLDKNKSRGALYGGTRDAAKTKYTAAKNDFQSKLNAHTEHEYAYEQQLNTYRKERNELKASLASDPSNAALQVKMDDLNSEIKKFIGARKLENAKEMQELQGAQELLEQRRIEYGNAKHEDRPLRRTRTVFETAIGATTFEDMQRNMRNENYKIADKASKELSKLDVMEKIVKEEEELRALTRQLGEEQRKYATKQSVIGMDDSWTVEEKNAYMNKNRKEILRELNSNFNESINETKQLNIQSSVISKALSQYMAEYNVQDITDKDVNLVLDNVENILQENPSREITFSTNTRNKVRKAVKEKMIKDLKGNGFNKKDAITAIRSALGQEGVMDIKSTEEIEDPKIKELQEKIMSKINSINTYNEVGKVKYKENLVNINKIIKDAKKRK